MKRNYLFLTIGLLFILAVGVWSCKKTEETEPILDDLKQETEVNGFFDEVLTEVDEMTFNNPTKALEEDTSFFSGLGSRTRITYWDGNCRVDSVSYTNYVNPNARFTGVKNGVIRIRICGQYTGQEFVRTITFHNFSINGNLIEGTKIITKTANNTFNISLTNGRITFTDGTTYTRTLNRTRTWLEGYNTPFQIWDDVYSLEGFANGVNRNGKTYDHQITNDLIFRLNCPWIVQGVVAITVGEKQAVIDFGNGQCDNSVSITYNGRTYEIQLRGGRQ